MFIGVKVIVLTLGFNLSEKNDCYNTKENHLKLCGVFFSDYRATFLLFSLLNKLTVILCMFF